MSSTQIWNNKIRSSVKIVTMIGSCKKNHGDGNTVYIEF